MTEGEPNRESGVFGDPDGFRCLPPGAQDTQNLTSPPETSQGSNIFSAMDDAINAKDFHGTDANKHESGVFGGGPDLWDNARGHSETSDDSSQAYAQAGPRRSENITGVSDPSHSRLKRSVRFGDIEYIGGTRPDASRTATLTSRGNKFRQKLKSCCGKGGQDSDSEGPRVSRSDHADQFSLPESPARPSGSTSMGPTSPIPKSKLQRKRDQL